MYVPAFLFEMNQNQGRHPIRYQGYDYTLPGARLGDPSNTGGPPLASPLHEPQLEVFGRLKPGSLGAVIDAYKSTVARLINGLRHTRGAPIWQRNYYERVLRNEREWDAACRYIQANPINWVPDPEWMNS